MKKDMKKNLMVKRLMTLALLMILHSSFFTLHSMAQKFALVDMDYILKNIPAYERANEQLNQVSKKWQAEVDALTTEAQTLYKNYQNELVFLSAEQKKAKQDAIMEKEKQASELKRKYFGQEGELYKKREALIKPIQDEVYNAIQEVANEKRIDIVKDRSADPALIYMSSKLDISDQVLHKLGAK